MDKPKDHEVRLIAETNTYDFERAVEEALEEGFIIKTGLVLSKGSYHIVMTRRNHAPCRK